MAARTKATAQESAVLRPDLVLTRVFDAPRALVFEAWVRPEHLAAWWGPDHFTNPVCEVDARVGGALRIHMRGPDGTVYPMSGTFTELAPPGRLAFLGSPLDAKGAKIFESLTMVTFAEQGRQTLVTLSVQVLTKTPEADMYLAGMREGWTQSLGRLERQLRAMAGFTAGDGLSHTFRATALPGEATFTLTRVFAAPRELVFDASTQCEHLRHWWGPVGMVMTECEIDLRPGGAWRHVLAGPDGVPHPFKGVYLDIARPALLAHTFIFDVDGYREHDAVVTALFQERDGRTTLTSTTRHRSVESRDGHYRQGSRGMRETFERLADLLARIRSA